MHPIDSIRTDRPQTIHPVNSSVGVILPKIEFVDNIPTERDREESPRVERKITYQRKPVELTADSTNYLIIAPSAIQNAGKETTYSFNFKKDTSKTQRFDSIFFAKPTEAATLGNNLNQTEVKDSTNTTTQIEVSGHQGIKTLFSVEQQDGIFALLLLCFFSFSYIFKDGLSFLKESSRLIFSTRKNSGSYKETTVTVFWYNIILLFQSVLLIAIVLFDFFLEKYKLFEPSNYFITVISLIIAIYLFIGLKIAFYKLSGYIFNLQERTRAWIRNYLLLFEILGIVAFIPTLLLIYSDYFHDIIFFFLATLFVITRLIIIYRASVNFLREKVNFLFLIVYLCTIEILPYYFLYKGLIFLYKLDITSILLWH